MNILAIDPGTKCGWAYRINGATDSGVWDLSVKKDESANMRLIRLRSELNRIARMAVPELLIYEAPRNQRFANAIKVAGMIQGLMEVWCHDNEVDFVGKSPREIKKHATGSGKADKDAMISAARELFPDIKIIDDNHADALCLLQMGRDLYE